MSGESDRVPRILVGERDPFMRNALARVLTPHFRVEFAEDGQQVLQRARAERPAVIVLEALLPRGDGFQVCRQLKSDPATREIPVLLFTLLLAEERGRQAGADAYLQKPLRGELLLSTIEQLLEGGPASNGHGTLAAPTH